MQATAPAEGNSERAITLRRALATDGATREQVMQSSQNAAIIEATYGPSGQAMAARMRGGLLGVA